MTYAVLVFLFVLVSGLGGFAGGCEVGRRAGIAAERLRVVRAFDVAMGILYSGALIKVRRRVVGQYDDEQYRMALIRECDHRARERFR